MNFLFLVMAVIGFGMAFQSFGKMWRCAEELVRAQDMDPSMTTLRYHLRGLAFTATGVLTTFGGCFFLFLSFIR